jgi:glyoxylase-like metal-dependent hydrolase (beta-lactamase superfamily II)
VYLARPLAPTATLERVVQLDRVGKGCLSYVRVSAGQAAVIDPGRHLARYEAVLDELGATPAAVIDTHMHADYVSGAAAAARRWSVPYYLHPDDARSPYDGAPGRVTHAPLSVAEPVSFGRAALQVEHRPGHSLGSVVLRVDGLAFTGDFLFVASVGRPDLGEQADAWGRLLWRSLEESRASWPGDTLVLPAHYTAETERRADRTVGARLDVIAATNPALAVQDESGFLAWLARHASPAPATYRTIKLANLGLAALSDSEIEAVEVGPNQCAVA